jgi:hypothetical protein
MMASLMSRRERAARQTGLLTRSLVRVEPSRSCPMPCGLSFGPARGGPPHRDSREGFLTLGPVTAALWGPVRRRMVTPLTVEPASVLARHFERPLEHHDGA